MYSTQIATLPMRKWVNTKPILVQARRQFSIQLFLTLILCSTLVSLPTVYPTHFAFRVNTEIAAIKASSDSPPGRILTAQTVRTLTTNACCSKTKPASGIPDRTSCRLCIEFDNFIVLAAAVSIVPEYIETIIRISTLFNLPVVQEQLLYLPNRSPPLNSPAT